MKHTALANSPAPSSTVAEVNIHLRAREQDRNLIDRAADLVGTNGSQFMLTSALKEAKNVLIDQSTIFTDAKTFQKVMNWMDRPATSAETAAWLACGMPRRPGVVADSQPLFDSPILLTKSHDNAAFDSGEPTLDEWLRQRAWANLQLAASRTYIVCPTGSNTVIDYAALGMGQILAQEATGAMRRNIPRHIPALLFGRLAMDRAWQGKGLGRPLLADVVRRALLASEQISARLVIVHAISPAAEAFHLHHGFTRLPVETPTLALDLVKFQKVTSSR